MCLIKEREENTEVAIFVKMDKIKRCFCRHFPLKIYKNFLEKIWPM